MPQKSYYYSIPVVLLCLLPSLAKAYPIWGKDFTNERKIFLSTEARLKQNKKDLYRKNKYQLKSYPLYPYLESLDMQSRLHTVSAAEIKLFNQHYPNSPTARKLTNKWLFQAAKKRQWSNFLTLYKPTSNTELNCFYLQARYATTPTRKILQQAIPIWLQAKSQPKSCDPIFTLLEKNRLLTRSLIWERIKISIQANNIQLARYLAKKLNKGDRVIVELWIKINANPLLIAKKHYFTFSHAMTKEIIFHGLSKIAKKEPLKAIRLWQQAKNNIQFTKDHQYTLIRHIGLALAKDYPTEAKIWLERLPKEYINNAVSNTHLKIMLAKNRWDSLVHYSRSLPSEVKNTEKWRYWEARSLEMTGNKARSQALLSQLSNTRSYYGFLSSNRLLQPYSFKIKKSHADITKIRNLYQIPGIQRAYELKKLGRPVQARIEWLNIIKDMNEEEKQIAAKLSSIWKIPNWSIMALANAKDKDSLNLRFPKHYSQSILTASRRNYLDPALIFAVTRQESAFVPTARSPAGALGLMQLMPRTAKTVAKKMGVPIRNNYDILNTDKNIKIGTKYLKMMLEKHQNNPVLAAAAYNAGPARIEKWLPDYDMAADTWIEMIPFKETRNYVQNILTYTVIYQELLGKKPRLKKAMPMIKGKKKN